MLKPAAVQVSTVAILVFELMARIITAAHILPQKVAIHVRIHVLAVIAHIHPTRRAQICQHTQIRLWPAVAKNTMGSELAKEESSDGRLHEIHHPSVLLWLHAHFSEPVAPLRGRSVAGGAREHFPEP